MTSLTRSALSRRVLLQMLAVQADVEIAQQREDHDHGAEQKNVQLGAEAETQAQPASASWFSLLHAPVPAETSGTAASVRATGSCTTSSLGKMGRYFTARPNRAKPMAMIMPVTASSVHLGK